MNDNTILLICYYLHESNWCYQFWRLQQIFLTIPKLVEAPPNFIPCTFFADSVIFPGQKHFYIKFTPNKQLWPLNTFEVGSTKRTEHLSHWSNVCVIIIIFCTMLWSVLCSSKIVLARSSKTWKKGKFITTILGERIFVVSFRLSCHIIVN